jgi:hypothetical protein
MTQPSQLIRTQHDSRPRLVYLWTCWCGVPCLRLGIGSKFFRSWPYRPSGEGEHALGEGKVVVAESGPL